MDADAIVFEYLLENGPIGLASLERNPPGSMTGSQARVAAQRLVTRGSIRLDANLRLAAGAVRKMKAKR